MAAVKQAGVAAENTFNQGLGAAADGYLYATSWVPTLESIGNNVSDAYDWTIYYGNAAGSGVKMGEANIYQGGRKR